MKKLVKILTVILSGMLVFSAVSCKQKNEEIPEPSRDIPDLTVASEYDQGGLHDGITLSAEFYYQKEDINPYHMRVCAKVDAALAYAIDGATYSFCFAETGVNAVGEEATVVKNTESEKLDDVFATIRFPVEDDAPPYMHASADIYKHVGLYVKDDQPASPDYIQFSQNKGTVAIEFNLDAGGRKYSHDLIFDYDIADGKIQCKEINRMSDYDISGQLKTEKTAEENGDVAGGMPDRMFDTRLQRSAYYTQDMNAGKGYYNAWSGFGTFGLKDAYMVWSVNSFAGYFDSSSPLTDWYISFGAFGARSRAFTRTHDKYASLVIVSREINENGSVVNEKSRAALEFLTTDKRNHGTGSDGQSMRMHAQRFVVTEQDFIGDRGEI
ncbi:MAG: hypothetical protein KH405_03695, partial [Firmicutes bacterium]|nr:hypothetical protein [Bacillota bacterium]